MAKFHVFMTAVVSTTVEVEAEDREEAIEKAYEKGTPGLMFLDHTYPDEGDWMIPSEMFPEYNNPEFDVIEL